MAADSFSDLLRHIKHKIACVYYGESKEDAWTVSVECETCHEVIVSYDRDHEDHSSVRG